MTLFLSLGVDWHGIGTFSWFLRFADGFNGSLSNSIGFKKINRQKRLSNKESREKTSKNFKFLSLIIIKVILTKSTTLPIPETAKT